MLVILHPYEALMLSAILLYALSSYIHTLLLYILLHMYTCAYVQEHTTLQKSVCWREKKREFSDLGSFQSFRRRTQVLPPTQHVYLILDIDDR